MHKENTQISQQKNQTQKSLKIQEEQTDHLYIENYYGAHKTYKTDFRNKKFKHVYNQLIHRRPSQNSHQDIYYQDLLISIIKTLEWSFYTKQNFVQNIQPFYHFGKQAFKQFYMLFLVQKRIIDGYTEIEQKKSTKISLYFSLLVEFSGKMAFFLKQQRDYKNAQKIFTCCYQKIIKKVIMSSTSNTQLLKKCVEFFLIYACFALQKDQINTVFEIILDSLKILMNLVILIEFQLGRNVCKRKKSVKKYIKILRLLVKTLWILAFYSQKKGKYSICYYAINDAFIFQKIIKGLRHKYNGLTNGFENLFQKQNKEAIQLSQICLQFFKIEQIQKLQPIQLTSYYPYQFTIKDNEKMHSKKFVASKKPNYLNTLFQKKNQKTLKQVRFRVQSAQFGKNKKQTSLQLAQSEECQLYTPMNSSIKDTPQSSLQQQLTTNKSIAISIKNIEKFDHRKNIRKFWGIQNLQSTIKPKRTYSVDIGKNNKIKLQNQNKRKLSYHKNITHKQLQQKQQIYLKKNIICTNYQKYSKNTVMHKKSTKFRKFDFKNARNKFMNYERVQQKVNNWHKQSQIIQKQLNGCLLQLKNKTKISKFDPIIKQIQQDDINAQKQKIRGKNLPNQLEIVYDAKQCVTQSKDSSYKKMKGINLLRYILLQNKKLFKIVKPDLFAQKTENNDLIKINMSRKSLLPNQNAQKSTNKEQFDKNHEKACKNIDFFLKQYQLNLANKKKISKGHHPFKKQAQIQNRKFVYCNENVNHNSNLFISSLKATFQG